MALVELRRPRRRSEAQALALVLAAAGIAFEVVPVGSAHSLCVAPEDAARALAELELYERENPAAAPRAAPRPTPQAGLAGLDAALAAAALLLFVFVADRRELLTADLVGRGAAVASLIRAGEWWRALTALTLHSDEQHLSGNLAFTIAFGVLAAQRLGPGLAWLTILLSGGLGNLLNAYLHWLEHAAIGASTALMGALGLVAGCARRDRRVPWRGGLQRWAPLSAGILLLVFVGTGGERTDIGGHIAGFAVGCVMGLFLADPRLAPPMGRRAQWLYGLLAVALLAIAWLLALASPQPADQG